MRYASLRQGLVGAWCPSVSGPFGNRLPDLSGYGGHGTLTNMDPPNDWIINGGKGALDFDGSNDYLTANVFSGKLSSSFSLSLWINSYIAFGTIGTVFTQAYCIGYGGASENLMINCRHDNSSYAGSFIMKGNNSYPVVKMTSPPSAGIWANLVMTWNGATIKGFVNGISQGSAANTTFGSVTSQSVFVGSDRSASRFLNCIIDDIRIYNRALTEQEIRLLASERGIGLKPERQRNRYMIPRNRSSRFLGFPS